MKKIRTKFVQLFKAHQKELRPIEVWGFRLAAAYVAAKLGIDLGEAASK